MPIMSKIGSISSLANNAELSLQPGAGIEWIVHTIFYEGAVELTCYDGTNTVLVDSDTAAGAFLGLSLHCNSSVYYKIKNISGGTMLVGFDGVVSIST